MRVEDGNPSRSSLAFCVAATFLLMLGLVAQHQGKQPGLFVAWALIVYGVAAVSWWAERPPSAGAEQSESCLSSPDQAESDEDDAA